MPKPVGGRERHQPAPDGKPPAGPCRWHCRSGKPGEHIAGLVIENDSPVRGWGVSPSARWCAMPSPSSSPARPGPHWRSRRPCASVVAVGGQHRHRAPCSSPVREGMPWREPTHHDANGGPPPRGTDPAHAGSRGAKAARGGVRQAGWHRLPRRPGAADQSVVVSQVHAALADISAAPPDDPATETRPNVSDALGRDSVIPKMPSGGDLVERGRRSQPKNYYW